MLIKIKNKKYKINLKELFGDLLADLALIGYVVLMIIAFLKWFRFID